MSRPVVIKRHGDDKSSPVVPPLGHVISYSSAFAPSIQVCLVLTLLLISYVKS